MLIGTKDKNLLILATRSPGRYELFCTCPPRRRRKDGTCWHTEALLRAMKPWHRARTWVALKEGDRTYRYVKQRLRLLPLVVTPGMIANAAGEGPLNEEAGDGAD